MIIVVIGQSGAGKTTFVKSRFLKGAAEPLEGYPVPCTRYGNTVAIGRYEIGKRCEGTDTISYTGAPLIIETIKRLVAEKRNVLLEGDRVNNARTLSMVGTLGVPVKLYLLRCKVEISLSRLRKAGSKITESFVKATQTKARNNFIRFGERYEGEVISTDEGL